ncbi:MAG: coproporphyrinogen III oxidase [Candidatus Izimaplasma bacterium HR2]|nr:MAG: coproporphyrinogen III oxidase [Candidatus Izimaplasma bacterium HR2]
MNLMTKEKRYNTLNAFYRYKFGKKVFKVSLNGNFTCPNKDGKSAYGGCVYCTESGSGDFAGNKDDSLQSQFKIVKDMMHEKWSDGLYISYFQANTNTYDTVDRLRSLYYEAISLDKDIVGLSIATRCDALDNDIYDLLEELNNKTYLQIELGLQSIHDETSKFINRAHSLKCFDDAVKELRKRNIDVVVHIINGFHMETKEDMLETVRHLNKLDIQGIKIHLLHIMKKTKLGKMFLENPFKMLTLDEYKDIVCDQLEILDPNIIVHRLTGDSPRELLIAPLWSLKKLVVMNEIDKELRKRDVYQGNKFKK